MSAPSLAQATSSLPNELWIRSSSYLSEKDLFVAGNASKQFQTMSSDDILWEPLCRKRWMWKQNVRRFLKRSVGERGRENHNGVTCCSDAIRPYCSQMAAGYVTPTGWYRGSTPPALNMSEALLHPPTSWKEAYIMAEMDSRRTWMTREELIHFKWQLIYGGSPSQTGLRQFNANGTYTSPYLGTCEWVLRGRHLSFSGMTLLVERDANTWGWIVGRRERTEYFSVDPSAPPPSKQSKWKRSLWRCDVCQTATFEDKNEAIEHENQCRRRRP